MRWLGRASHLAIERDGDITRTSHAAGGQPGAAGWFSPLRSDAMNDATNSDESDLAAFCALIDAQAAALIRVAAALVGSADAEDAAQEAIMRAWRAWPDLRARSAARSWLISITVNVCRDWLRGRFGARRRLTESLTGDDDEQRPIAQIDADPGASDYAAALDLRHALTTLDDDLRMIVALRYYAGMDSTTIGAALGLPATTIRTKLRRALTLLRARLSVDPDSADSEGRR